MFLPLNAGRTLDHAGQNDRFPIPSRENMSKKRDGLLRRFKFQKEMENSKTTRSSMNLRFLDYFPNPWSFHLFAAMSSRLSLPFMQRNNRSCKYGYKADRGF